MAKKSHKPYKFQEIKHSPDGILACGLAILSAVLIIAELIITISVRGQAGGMIGLMGIAAFLFSIVGFIFAIISWKDEESEDLSKRAGTFSNIALIIVNICVIILGI
ncbi:MAG: DUF6142 family protein [Bacteroides sp.]|nr:DUF6142 family protein [Bacteroides sp.]MCM1550586.1 DUF6142 family protein [Clostridium sp.]